MLPIEGLYPNVGVRWRPLPRGNSNEDRTPCRVADFRDVVTTVDCEESGEIHARGIVDAYLAASIQIVGHQCLIMVIRYHQHHHCGQL